MLARAITNALRYEELPLTILGPIDPNAIQLAKTTSRQVLDATDIVQLNHDLRRLHNLNGSYAEPLVLSAWIDRGSWW